MTDTVSRLEEAARQIRRDIVTMIHQSGDGHPAPALSCTDLLAVLYFEVMAIDPSEPLKEGRDRLILSKGHACPALYAALAHRGYFDKGHYPTLRRYHSILQGHPVMQKAPGVDMTSGSLGNGLSMGVGLALANRYRRNEAFTYVITGDGELQEGVVWEGAMAAVQFGLDRLIVFVDLNGLQSGGPVAQVSGLGDVPSKFEAFGWSCQQIDGHDIGQILGALDRARAQRGRPSVIVARTVKGKGIPFMEGDNAWHKKLVSEADLALALGALGGVQP